MKLNLYLIGKVKEKKTKTKIRVLEFIHCHLHYKSSRPERRKRSKRVMCSLLLLVTLVKNLNRSLGMNTCDI